MTRLTRWGLAGALTAAAVIVTLPFTVTFRRWVFDFLPLLVLLACALLHLVTHRLHGTRHEPSDERTTRDVRPRNGVCTPDRDPRRANPSVLAPAATLQSVEWK